MSSQSTAQPTSTELTNKPLQKQYNTAYLQDDIKKLFKAHDKSNMRALDSSPDDFTADTLDRRLEILKQQRNRQSQIDTADGTMRPTSTKSLPRKSRKSKQAPVAPIMDKQQMSGRKRSAPLSDTSTNHQTINRNNNNIGNIDSSIEQLSYNPQQVNIGSRSIVGEENSQSVTHLPVKSSDSMKMRRKKIKRAPQPVEQNLDQASLYHTLQTKPGESAEQANAAATAGKRDVSIQTSDDVETTAAEETKLDDPKERGREESEGNNDTTNKTSEADLASKQLSSPDVALALEVGEIDVSLEQTSMADVRHIHVYGEERMGANEEGPCVSVYQGTAEEKEEEMMFDEQSAGRGEDIDGRSGSEVADSITAHSNDSGLDESSLLSMSDKDSNTQSSIALVKSSEQEESSQTLDIVVEPGEEESSQTQDVVGEPGEEEVSSQTLEVVVEPGEEDISSQTLEVVVEPGEEESSQTQEIVVEHGEEKVSSQTQKVVMEPEEKEVISHTLEIVAECSDSEKVKSVQLSTEITDTNKQDESAESSTRVDEQKQPDTTAKKSRGSVMKISLSKFKKSVKSMVSSIGIGSSEKEKTEIDQSPHDPDFDGEPFTSDNWVFSSHGRPKPKQREIYQANWMAEAYKPPDPAVDSPTSSGHADVHEVEGNGLTLEDGNGEDGNR